MNSKGHIQVPMMIGDHMLADHMLTVKKYHCGKICPESIHQDLSIGGIDKLSPTFLRSDLPNFLTLPV